MNIPTVSSALCHEGGKRVKGVHQSVLAWLQNVEHYDESLL